jgi:hypothetical protein
MAIAGCRPREDANQRTDPAPSISAEPPAPAPTPSSSAAAAVKAPVAGPSMCASVRPRAPRTGALFASARPIRQAELEFCVEALCYAERPRKGSSDPYVTYHERRGAEQARHFAREGAPRCEPAWLNGLE